MLLSTSRKKNDADPLPRENASTTTLSKSKVKQACSRYHCLSKKTIAKLLKREFVPYSCRF